MTFKDGVMHIIKGDDENIRVKINAKDGYEYSLGENDFLTLTVKKRPDDDETIIMSVNSTTGSNIIKIPHDITGALEPGYYSADIQLTIIEENGDEFIKTIWNGVKSGNHGKTANWKNFCIDAEVTTPAEPVVPN